MQTEGMVARVRREVEIHSRLKHPSILEVRRLLVEQPDDNQYGGTCDNFEYCSYQSDLSENAWFHGTFNVVSFLVKNSDV